MKLHCVALIVLCSLCTPVVGLAQLPTGPQTGLNAALLKLFDGVDAFRATADVRLSDNAQRQTLSMPMEFALLQGMMRAEVDMSQIQSAEINSAVLGQFKQLGMDRVISIMLPAKKQTLVVYPALQAYAEVPMPPEEAAGLQKKYQISKTKLGKETVAGQAALKTKVLLTAGKNEKHEATVWYATALKEFPVQMQMVQNDGSLLMTFRNVRLVRPEANLFAAPQNYTRYTSIEQMMQAAMAKMLGGGAAPK